MEALDWVTLFSYKKIHFAAGNLRLIGEYSSLVTFRGLGDDMYNKPLKKGLE